MGHINLRKKCIGKPSEGKLHAGFDEAGDGNGLNYENRDITAPSLDPTLGEGAVATSLLYPTSHFSLPPLS